MHMHVPNGDMEAVVVKRGKKMMFLNEERHGTGIIPKCLLDIQKKHYCLFKCEEQQDRTLEKKKKVSSNFAQSLYTIPDI